MSRALIELAQPGIEAEASAKDNLQRTYDRFMSAADTEQKQHAGNDLIRAIFGEDAVAEDSIRWSPTARLGTPVGARR